MQLRLDQNSLLHRPGWTQMHRDQKGCLSLLSARIKDTEPLHLALGFWLLLASFWVGFERERCMLGCPGIGTCRGQSTTLPNKPSHQPLFHFLRWGGGEWGITMLPRDALNLQSSCSSLTSIQDYKCTPLHLVLYQFVHKWPYARHGTSYLTFYHLTMHSRHVAHQSLYPTPPELHRSQLQCRVLI